MDPYSHLPPDRRPARHDFGLLFIFFLTIALMGGVVAFLTAGWAWTPPQIPNVLKVETRSSNLFGSGVLNQPNGATPTPVGAATDPAASPTKVAASTATATATSTTTPTVTAQAPAYVIGNTDGVGAWLRRTPRMDDYLISWVDGTRMEVVGPDVNANGIVWKNVRDPRGDVGFIPAEWLVPAQ
ncbi:MAG: hypothetical protein M1401_10265 [Chloroflexi bacterium]|nr:hypothetical protein [Chloroflexota bacterium]